MVKGNYKNQINWRILLFLLILPTFIVLFSTTLYLFDPSSKLALTACYILAIVIYIPFIYQELFIRPRTVSIDEAGIELLFAFGKKLQVPRSKIKWKPLPRGIVIKSLYVDSMLQLDGRRFPFPINNKIAAIIENG